MRNFSTSTLFSDENVNPKKKDRLLFKCRVRSLEFKYLYFEIQKLFTDHVKLVLRCDQLKTPEIHATLIKPLTDQITNIGLLKNILPLVLNRFSDINQTDCDNKYYDSVEESKKCNNYQKLFAQPKVILNSFMLKGEDNKKVSDFLIFILLLLRYEFLIQLETNLILYDLLITKSNVCELLAIRMLREYTSFRRIKLMFLAPLKLYMISDNKKHHFNTLELSYFSKSKKFLSQPVIVNIITKFFNGELVFVNNADKHNFNFRIDSKINKIELLSINEENDDGFGYDIVYYKYNMISIKEIIQRSKVIPKYQSIVINLKLFFFLILYFILIFNKKNFIEEETKFFLNFIDFGFWFLGLNFNIEFLVKFLNIEFRFLKKVFWIYIDFILIFLINLCFLLKITKSNCYHDFLSLISIIMIPRILSIFNTYKFFSVILLSFNKMMFNLIGLICLFFFLISGFYLSFITLSTSRKNSEIMFEMIKIFFGYTPAVWNNWSNYNTLGKIIQMSYLLLIQFFIGTILAITLSQVFVKVNQNIDEEFHYYRTINFIHYFRVSSLNKSSFDKKNNKSCSFISKFHYKVLLLLYGLINLFKLPVIVLIYCYELMRYKFIQKEISIAKERKFFTFLDKQNDFFTSNFKYMDLNNNKDSKNALPTEDVYVNDSDFDNNTSVEIYNGPLILEKSRKNLEQNKIDLHLSKKKNKSRMLNKRLDKNKKISKKITSLKRMLTVRLNRISNENRSYKKKFSNALSYNSIGNDIRSGSTDSVFINKLLNKKYGIKDCKFNSDENFFLDTAYLTNLKSNLHSEETKLLKSKRNYSHDYLLLVIEKLSNLKNNQQIKFNAVLKEKINEITVLVKDIHSIYLTNLNKDINRDSYFFSETKMNFYKNHTISENDLV